MNRQLRKSLSALALMGLALIALSHVASAAVLTGITHFSSNGNGTPSGQVWDTVAGGLVWDLTVYAEGRAVNDPANHRAEISIGLHVGTNRITFAGTLPPQQIVNFYGFNLFFDGHVAPDISAKGGCGGTVLTNFAPTTLAMNEVWSLPAAGKLDYTVPAEKVTLIDFQSGCPASGGTAIILVEPTVEYLAIRCSEVEIAWPSLSNVSYQVEYRSSLTSNVFVPIGPAVQGTGTTNLFRDQIPAGEGQRYYRVSRVP